MSMLPWRLNTDLNFLLEAVKENCEGAKNEIAGSEKQKQWIGAAVIAVKEMLYMLRGVNIDEFQTGAIFLGYFDSAINELKKVCNIEDIVWDILEKNSFQKYLYVWDYIIGCMLSKEQINEIEDQIMVGMLYSGIKVNVVSIAYWLIEVKKANYDDKSVVERFIQNFSNKPYELARLKLIFHNKSLETYNLFNSELKKNNKIKAYSKIDVSKYFRCIHGADKIMMSNYLGSCISSFESEKTGNIEYFEKLYKVCDYLVKNIIVAEKYLNEPGAFEYKRALEVELYKIIKQQVELNIHEMALSTLMRCLKSYDRHNDKLHKIEYDDCDIMAEFSFNDKLNSERNRPDIVYELINYIVGMHTKESKEFKEVIAQANESCINEMILEYEECEGNNIARDKFVAMYVKKNKNNLEALACANSILISKYNDHIMKKSLLKYLTIEQTNKVYKRTNFYLKNRV